MARTNPTNIDLKWCETHDIMKAVLPDGTIYRLGTADIDVNGEHYVGDLTSESSAKQSATRSHDRVTLACQNADRVMGLTINEFSRQLIGADVTFSRAFRNVEIDWQANAGYSSNADMRGYRTRTAASSWGYPFLLSNDTISTSAGSVSYVVTSTSVDMRFGLQDSVGHNYTIYLVSSTYGGSVQFYWNGTPGVNGLVYQSGNNGYKIGDKLVVTLVNPDGMVFQHWRRGVLLTSYPIGLIGTNFPYRAVLDIYLAGTQVGGLDIDGHDFQAKEIMSGEIWDAPVDEDNVEITLVGELSSGLAYIADRALQSTCPLIFKGGACGYAGALTTCNKLYDSPDGCSGRANQHRFGGVIVRGELSRPIIGGIGGLIDSDGDIIRGGGGHWVMPFDNNFQRIAEMMY